MKGTFSILLIFIGFLSCVAQNGVINGKIIAEIPEEKQLISEQVKVILKIGNEEKIVSVDQNLEFKFQNLRSDSIQISTQPKSFGHKRIIIGFLKPNDTTDIEINFSLTCKYAKYENNKICPICKKEDKVIPIVYGLIAEVTRKGESGNKNEYKSGGCIITECDPNWFCKRDKIEF